MLFISGCSKETATIDENEPQNASRYNDYSFYKTDHLCSNGYQISKDFEKIADLPYNDKFLVSGSNLYTFGTKRFRTSPSGIYVLDFCDYLKNNGVLVRENTAGLGSSIISMQEKAGDLFYNTGFYTDQEAPWANVTTPKVWSNGTLLYNLQGPYTNSTTAPIAGPLTSNSFGIRCGKIKVVGNDIYIPGDCYSFQNDKVSVGYWKNEVYNQLWVQNSSNLGEGYFTGIDVSDNGDVYFGMSYIFLITAAPGFVIKNVLFKNGIDFH